MSQNMELLQTCHRTAFQNPLLHTDLFKFASFCKYFSHVLLTKSRLFEYLPVLSESLYMTICVVRCQLYRALLHSHFRIIYIDKLSFKNSSFQLLVYRKVVFQVRHNSIPYARSCLQKKFLSIKQGFPSSSTSRFPVFSRNFPDVFQFLYPFMGPKS